MNDLGPTVSGDGSGSPDAAEAVAEQIRSAGGEAIADWGSVADPAGAQRMVQAGLDRWGRLDAVVSNAGMSRNKPFDRAHRRGLRRHGQRPSTRCLLGDPSGL